MPVNTFAEEQVGLDLLPSPVGSLSADEIEALWGVFRAIASAWGGPDSDPILQRSHWLEFVAVKAGEPPSYLEEYRSAVRVLAELTSSGGPDSSQMLVLGGGPAEATTRIAHAKRFVVDEFIRVWLASGGFKSYGAANYNGYVSGSRFAVRPSYRHLP